MDRVWSSDWDVHDVSSWVEATGFQFRLDFDFWDNMDAASLYQIRVEGSSFKWLEKDGRTR
jgi:hypothetical protein